VNNLVFVADDTNGVVVFDVTDPTAPKAVGSIATAPQAAWDVIVRGQVGYIAAVDRILTFAVGAAPQVDATKISMSFDGQKATVTGAAGAVLGSAPLTIAIHNETNGNVANVTGVAVNVDGSFTANIASASGDVLDVTATDGAGRVSTATVIGSVPFGGATSTLSLTPPVSGDSSFRARRLGLDGTWMAATTYPGDPNFDSVKMAIMDMSSGTPVLKQMFSLPGGARDVVVRNGVAYVPDGSSGFEAIDLTAAPSATQNRASLDCSSGWSVLVDGTYAYVGDGCGDGRISIFDITNPKVPVKLRSQNFGGSGYAYTQLIAYGNYLIGVSPNVTNGISHDVSIFDRRDINNLVRVADLDIPNFAGFHASLAGSMLYIGSVAPFVGQMAIVDVSNPNAPVLKSVTATQNNAWDVIVSGTTAIIADGVGVTFFDVTNPSTPKYLGTQSVGGNAWGVRLWGGKLYVANEEGIATVSSIVVPPVVNKGLITTAQVVTGARVTGGAGSIGGTLPLTLTIHDESNNNTPDTTGVAVNTDGTFTATIGASAGDVLDVKVTDGNGLTSTKTVIASVPFGSSTTILNTIPLVNDSNYRARRIASDGTYVGTIMYPISWDSGRMLLFSLTSGTPVFSQNIQLLSGARDITIRNGTAYVPDGNFGFEAVDLTTNPATIKKASLDCSNAWGVGLDGNYAFVGDGCGDGRIDIFDITNPKSPVKVRSQSTEPNSGYAFTDLIPYGNYLVCMSPNTSNNVGHDVVVFDKTNINNLVKVGDLDIAGISLLEGRIYGHTLYASGDTGVVLVDLTTPAAPTLISKVVTPGVPRGVELDPATNRLYVADGTAGLTAIDVSIPTAPKILGSQAIGGNGWGVQLVGTNLLVASEDELSTISLVAATGTSLPAPAIEAAPALPPQPATETKLHAERGLIAVSFANGTATIRGAVKAVAGNEPLTVSITNATMGTNVPVVAVAADGSFEATISAAPGDHLTLRATSGSGEAVDVDLGEIPGAAPQGELRHLPIIHGLDVRRDASRRAA
jgi:hypothetical protein